MAASEKEGSSSIASFRARTGFDAFTKECAMGREKRPLPHAGLAARCAEGRVEGRCYADVCAEGAELSLRLTPREREVASLLGSGLKGPAVARALGISYNTFKTHMRHIYSKCDRCGVVLERDAVGSARVKLKG